MVTMIDPRKSVWFKGTSIFQICYNLSRIVFAAIICLDIFFLIKAFIWSTGKAEFLINLLIAVIITKLACILSPGTLPDDKIFNLASSIFVNRKPLNNWLCIEPMFNHIIYTTESYKEEYDEERQSFRNGIDHADIITLQIVIIRTDIRIALMNRHSMTEFKVFKNELWEDLKEYSDMVTTKFYNETKGQNKKAPWLLKKFVWLKFVKEYIMTGYLLEKVPSTMKEYVDLK